MTPAEQLISALEARGCAVQRSGERGWVAQCPVHDDRNASLSIGEGEDGCALIHCHAGCKPGAVTAALGRDMRDLFPDDRAATSNGHRRIAATYNYVDEAGKLLYEVVRFQPKDFRQRRPDGRGGWIWKLGNTRRVLYRLPHLIEAVASGRRVWIVEGEKDVHALEAKGEVATCNPGGAGKWRPEFAEFLRNAKVAIIADRDKHGRGRAHARDVVHSLEGVAAEIHVGEAAEGKDAADHLAAGRALSGFVRVDLSELAAESPGAHVDVAGSVSPPRPSWPAPLDAVAFHGLAGDIVRTIEPHTEADPGAILVSFLVAFGNVIGRGAGWKHGGTFHATNLFLLLVGPTGSGRKGTAGDEALRVLRMADSDWADRRIVNGLSSGEGVIWSVHDPITKRRKPRKGEEPDCPDGLVEEVDDPGEPDKRLLVMEAEFAQALKVMQREGNTLSPTLRRLWDRGDAASLTKSNPTRTTAALVSVIGHISAEELRRQLNDTEIANGFANRFIPWCTRRSKRLPFGGSLEDSQLSRFATKVGRAIDHARSVRELDMDEPAREASLRLYAQLDDDRLGILGAILRRGVPIVRRIAVIYALLDGDVIVREPHLRAAAAVWRYCEDSARFIFGDRLGHPLADKIRAELREAGTDGLSRAEIRERAGSNNIEAARIEGALDLLREGGLAEQFQRATGGRPAERWRSTELWEEWEESPPRALPDQLSSHSSQRTSSGVDRERGKPPDPHQEADHVRRALAADRPSAETAPDAARAADSAGSERPATEAEEAQLERGRRLLGGEA
jgi:hypothetical protein